MEEVPIQGSRSFAFDWIPEGAGVGKAQSSVLGSLRFLL